MLNEPALRRDGFRPGIPIRLADGQSWSFPSPASWFNATEWALDGVYGALLRAIDEAEDDAEQLRAELALAIHLIARNYALGPQEYQALFDFGPYGHGLAEAQQAFHELAVQARRTIRPHGPTETARAPRPLSRMGRPSPAGVLARLAARLRGDQVSDRGPTEAPGEAHS